MSIADGDLVELDAADMQPLIDDGATATSVTPSSLEREPVRPALSRGLLGAPIGGDVDDLEARDNAALANVVFDTNGTGPTGALKLAAEEGPSREPSSRASSKTPLLAAGTVIVVVLLVVGIWRLWRTMVTQPVAVMDAGTVEAVGPTTPVDAVVVAVVDAGAAEGPEGAGDAGLLDVKADVDAGVDAGVALDVDPDTSPDGTPEKGPGGKRKAPRSVKPPKDTGGTKAGPDVDVEKEKEKEKEKPEVAIVGRIAVSAEGFVVKGARSIRQGGATTLVIDDDDAPFRLRLTVKAVGDAGVLELQSEPWAIVRVGNVGQGRTPLKGLALDARRKTLISLQNPTGARMDVSVTFTPVRAP